MSVNYAKAYKEFETAQKKQVQEYRSLGMTECQISEMYSFDKKQFLSNLREQYHTQPLDIIDNLENSCDDESVSPLLLKFLSNLSVTDDNSPAHARYWWIDEIDDPALAGKLKRLSDDDKELLLLITFDGYTQSDVASMKSTTKQAISKKVCRIKKILK